MSARSNTPLNAIWIALWIAFGGLTLLTGCDQQAGLMDTGAAPPDPDVEALGLSAIEMAADAEQEGLEYSEEGLILATTRGPGGAWNQFGSGRLNHNSSNRRGPYGGVGTINTLTPTLGGTIGSEVGLVEGHVNEFVVSSYDPSIHMFDDNGNHLGVYTLPVTNGPRAVVYYDYQRGFIYTGAEGGGFYEISVDRTTTPYTLTLNASDATIGTIETSPKMAPDRSVYTVSQWGTVRRYTTNPLAIANTYAFSSEVVTGAPALANVHPSPGVEVIVATMSGNLYVLSQDLNTLLASNTTGAAAGDQYYGGVTVAPRPSQPPLALLGVAGGNGATASSNTGIIRAINLGTMAVVWELTPSMTTTGGTDEVRGSIALLRPGTGRAVASSTDGYLYGFNYNTGVETWSYAMNGPGLAAPATGRYNGVFVVDGTGYLHLLRGVAGTHVWTDTGMFIGSTTDIGKIGIARGRRLIVGSGSTAWVLKP